MNKERTTSICKGGVEPKRLYTLIFCISICGFLLLFFYRLHPLVVYDIDDWLYIGSHRTPFISRHQWNPARIFPEVFMPLISEVSANIIYPINNDYLGSLSLGYAITVSILILNYS